MFEQRQAAYARGYSASDFAPLLDELVQLGHELGNGVGLAQAAMMLDAYLGFQHLKGARALLTESLGNLPPGADCMRAAVRIRLAVSVPLGADLAAAHEKLESSLALARNSPDLGDQLTAYLGELYLFGGPAHRLRAARAVREMRAICTTYSASLTLPPVLLELHGALAALQEGDVEASTRALARAEARCQEFDIELLWHVQRLAALARIKAGQEAEGRAALVALHRRADEQGPIAGTELLIGYDRAVVLHGEHHGGEPRVLEPDVDDPPHVWALKLRARSALGAKDEVLAALTASRAAELRQRPCDREYLGMLASLARTVLTLPAPGFARVLYELLEPYTECFASSTMFMCEGPVVELLGMLARSFGEQDVARAHLDAAIAASERAGLTSCAAEARRERELCAAS